MVTYHGRVTSTCQILRFSKRYFLREGPSPRGAPSVPLFSPSFLEKRLDLKSLKGQTKAEELGTRDSKFLSLRLPLKALQIEPFLRCMVSYHTNLKIVSAQLEKV